MELHFTDRESWRSWLEKNHHSCKELWMIIYKKQTGKKGITYDEAVEEALCFGWIDGKIKSVNEEYYMRRFTPRNPRSMWSEKRIYIGWLNSAKMAETRKTRILKIVGASEINKRPGITL